MAALPPPRLLVVDDDADTRSNLCDILELDAYRVETAGTIAEALRRDGWADYAAIILDRKLPDGTAEDVLPRLRRLAPDAAILIVTGYADLDGAVTALQQGAADYILKPVNADALRASLARIAERRRLAQEKERTEAAFRTLVEAAPCAILILRPDETIAYFSPFAEEMTGYAAAAVRGQDYLALFIPPEYRDVTRQQLRRALDGQPSRGLAKPLRCRDGGLRWLVWDRRRLDDYEGGPAVLAVGQDITELKRAQEMALRSERLAAIGQMMTGLAHESGNALARSQACLEMLTWEVQDRPEALDLIGRVQKAQDHLKQLYEEVRGYAAPVKLEREPWELSLVWRQAWEHLSLLRQGRDARLEEHTGGIDLECAVDQFRLGQVFRNVFENALAACADPVRIEVLCSAAELDGRPAVRVAVRDNGPGLAPEQKQRIFEPFFTTKTKGTGLGMAIARRLVEAHGGTLAAESAPGQGATILLTLPREQP
ncbi:MAG TPA: ATP-binding protein [Gemmataceae bacterium]|nr:ATP-binding protein [Gemmataceae bacterium]